MSQQRLFTNASRKVLIERVRSAAKSLHANGCTRGEVFAFLIHVTPSIYHEIYAHQETASGNCFYPEQVIADIIGEVVAEEPLQEV